MLPLLLYHQIPHFKHGAVPPWKKSRLHILSILSQNTSIFASPSSNSGPSLICSADTSLC